MSNQHIIPFLPTTVCQARKIPWFWCGKPQGDIENLQPILTSDNTSLFLLLIEEETTQLKLKPFVFGELHETFPILTVAGLNFELATRGKRAITQWVAW